MYYKTKKAFLLPTSYVAYDLVMWLANPRHA
jgi:hypothetical protein